MQTIFSLHNLEADNFFQPTTACEQFFYEKGNPPPSPDKKIMVRSYLLSLSYDSSNEKYNSFDLQNWIPEIIKIDCERKGHGLIMVSLSQ